jgi:hypothetical protein
MLKLVSTEENPSTEDSFTRFWQLWPKRVAKAEAQKAWKKLGWEDKARALSALPDHISVWAERGDAQFIPYPASWLNGRRFEDELNVALEIKPCHWAGCKKNGTNIRGPAHYCDAHIMAIKRGETPVGGSR